MLGGTDELGRHPSRAYNDNGEGMQIMWLTSYVRTRKHARRLSAMTASGEAYANAGRWDEAKRSYSQAREYHWNVHLELSGQFGQRTAEDWDRRASHMLASLELLVSEAEVEV